MDGDGDATFVGTGASANGDWTDWPAPVLSTTGKILVGGVGTIISIAALSTFGSTISSFVTSPIFMWAGAALIEWVFTGRPRYSLKVAAFVGRGLWWGATRMFGRRAPA
jgi:hypothetical protein